MIQYHDRGTIDFEALSDHVLKSSADPLRISKEENSLLDHCSLFYQVLYLHQVLFYHENEILKF